MSGQEYQVKLDSVVKDLRRRYGADVPFLLGQMVPEEMELSHKDYSAIDAVHADTPNRDRRAPRSSTGERGCRQRRGGPSLQRPRASVRWAAECGRNTARCVATNWRSMRPGRRILTAVEAIVAVVVIIVVDMTISGCLLFTNAGVDTLQRADAIIVLGGEHDGREDYGLRLAREGWASTVVISNPYGPDDAIMTPGVPRHPRHQSHLQAARTLHHARRGHLHPATGRCTLLEQGHRH